MQDYRPERSEWERTTSLSQERDRGRGWSLGAGGCGVVALVGIAIIIALITKEPPLELASMAFPSEGGDERQPSRPAQRKPQRRRFALLRRWWRGAATDDEYEDVVVHPDEKE